MSRTNAFKCARAKLVTLLPGLLLLASVSLPFRFHNNTVSNVRLSSATRSTKLSSSEEPSRTGRAIADGPSSASNVTELSRNLPLSFETNCGQADEQVKFLSRGPGYCLLLKPTEVDLHFAAPALRDKAARNAANTSPGIPSISFANPSPELGFNEPRVVSMPDHKPEPEDISSSKRNDATTVVRMKLVGARSPLNIAGVDELRSKSNYVSGADARKWRKNVSNYSRVRYQGVYRGVDMVYYGHRGHLEYDFVVAPGSRTNKIRLAFEGTNNLSLGANGDLVLTTAAGEIRQHKPIAYQYVNGKRIDVAAEYAINEKSEVGFKLADYDPGRELIIDPVLTYSSYLGSSLLDGANSITVDSAGNVYLTGLTSSLNFPATQGALQSANRSVPGLYDNIYDVFVAKLSTTGAGLIYSTYIGGSGDDIGNGIAVDEKGNACVVGSTTSSDFPTTQGAYQTSIGSTLRFNELPSDAFVLALNPEGTGLVYSTYLGGSSADLAEGLALNQAGDVYVTGFSNSTNFPTTPDAFQRANSSLGAAFITKLDRAGAHLVYSTLLRGSKGADGHGIAIDSAGNAYVAGDTGSSDDFPVTKGAFQEVVHDFYSGFAAKLDPSGSTLVYSTYIGGVKESGSDVASAIAVDAQGCAYITGRTYSPDFPTTPGAFQNHKAKGAEDYFADAFVLKLNPAGTEAVYSTYLGGSESDSGNAIVVDSQGCAYVAGYTPSVNFPVTNAVQQRLSGGSLLTSTDDGGTWRVVSIPGSAAFGMRFQPGDPATFYVTTDEGFLKTADGGLTWVPFGPVGKLVSYYADLQIDPQTPSTMFFNAVNGLYKSTDGGVSWEHKMTGSSYMNGIFMDPLHTSTVYLATFDDLRKSTDGGDTWNVSPLQRDGPPGYEEGPLVQTLLIDPQNTSTLYVGIGSAIFKSTDGARSWTRLTVDPDRFSFSLRGIDPRTTTTLYAMSYIDGLFNVYKSVDGGSTWRIIGKNDTAGTLTIDPANTSVIYLRAFDEQQRSTDGGVSWNPLPLGNVAGTVFINPQTSALYLPMQTYGDAFIAKVSADGTSLMSSTYFGGYSYESCHSVAIDSVGNVYAAGQSGSSNVPTRPGAFSVAYGGGAGDSFIIKLGAPKITGVSINRKALSVTGANFDRGSAILLNGKQQKTESDETSPTAALTSKKAGKRISAGEQVVIQVKNSDGTLSQQFSFTRPAGQ